MRVYCAAPMRGYPRANHLAIDAAVRRLRDQGHETHSPADRDRDRGFDPARAPGPEYLRNALAVDCGLVLSDTDIVVVLPGWERSKGAQAEVHLAMAIGTPVQELEGFLAGNGTGVITWERLHPEQAGG